jgi:hypothetical protein
MIERSVCDECSNLLVKEGDAWVAIEETYPLDCDGGPHIPVEDYLDEWVKAMWKIRTMRG